MFKVYRLIIRMCKKNIILKFFLVEKRCTILNGYSVEFTLGINVAKPFLLFF